ncbi:DoxX family protein, partial [Candidatus Woesearchaeota archaeon]|nr:DoxX family protein [Candidatus Woesearchaeota archaeon]
MESSKGYGLAILRIVIGILFLLPGIMKLMDPAGITGMLTGLGFPAPSLLAWVLLLSEIIFGASLI